MGASVYLWCLGPFSLLLAHQVLLIHAKDLSPEKLEGIFQALSSQVTVGLRDGQEAGDPAGAGLSSKPGWPLMSRRGVPGPQHEQPQAGRAEGLHSVVYKHRWAGRARRRS